MADAKNRPLTPVPPCSILTHEPLCVATLGISQSHHTGLGNGPVHLDRDCRMPQPNFDNRTLFHCDNLPVLRGMDTETVHLIATDPPFNKGRDFHATPDSLADGARFQDRWSWDRDVHEDWVDGIKDDWPAIHAIIEASKVTYGDDIAAFLCFMAVRLVEMHRVLKPTGSLFLHCDPTASHYLKALMDAVFGRQNFQNELVWKRTSSRSDAKRFGRVHDVLLYYVKDGGATWNPQYEPHDPEYVRRFYRQDDHDGRGPWQSADLTASGLRRGETGKVWRGVDPNHVGRHWSTPTQGGMATWIEVNAIPTWREIESVHERLEALDSAGLIHWPKAGKGMPRLKRYLSSTHGNAVCDVITDVSPLSYHSKEKTGYPTQKPLALYECIIQAASNEGDVVLDPFCGCATTPIAAERLGRQWVGIDIWDSAYKTVLDRLESEGLAVPHAPEDIEEPSNGRLLTFGDIYYSKAPPDRTDEGEVAAPILRLKLKRPMEPWQRLSHKQIVDHLVTAQTGVIGMVVCAGCGRELEREFMQLDHIQPRVEGGANDITNRILLCQPCNGRKSADLTLRDLIRENKRQNWMQSESRAKLAQDSARVKADMIRDGLIG